MDQPFSAQVGSDGRATIKVRPPSLTPWVVQQVSVEMPDAPLGATCELRKNGALVSPVIATGDAAGGDPAIDVTQSDTLTIEWRGCTPGAYGRALVIYEERTQ